MIGMKAFMCFSTLVQGGDAGRLYFLEEVFLLYRKALGAGRQPRRGRFQAFTLSWGWWWKRPSPGASAGIACACI